MTWFEALDMKAKFQALRTRAPQPHGNLTDLAANPVFDVVLPHRIRLAHKFQRQANPQRRSDQSAGPVSYPWLVIAFGERRVRGPENCRVPDSCPDKMSVLVPDGTSTFREFSKRRNFS